MKRARKPDILRAFRTGWWLLAAGTACVAASDDPPPDDGERVDTAVASVPAPPPVAELRPKLSPAADTVAQRLVFAPTIQRAFVAAGRRGRLLVDLGRVDLDVARPASRLAAFREAVAARSPVPRGTRLRVRGPWGADDVEVAGFDVWNGRIVATLNAPEHVLSIARQADTLVALAQAADTAAERREGTCIRTTEDTAAARVWAVRLDSIRDSVLAVLRETQRPPSPALAAAVTSRSSRAFGCFERGSALLFVSLHAGDYDWARERTLLVDSTGAPRPIEVSDFRFRVHEALHALDADEDGVDDVAVRAWTPGGGGTVVLRLVNGRRLERLAAGFAWER
ncbi:MAG TPA: hypothetical protein VLE53_14650 [Gemmatimonadaceae bacterium]|nr:hypothetical protein [Gemmatimonadaceae bacterium]